MLQKIGSIRRGLVAAVGVFALGASLMAAAPAKAGDHHHSSFFFGFGFPVGGGYRGPIGLVVDGERGAESGPDRRPGGIGEPGGECQKAVESRRRRGII